MNIINDESDSFINDMVQLQINQIQTPININKTVRDIQFDTSQKPDISTLEAMVFSPNQCDTLQLNKEWNQLETPRSQNASALRDEKTIYTYIQRMDYRKLKNHLNYLASSTLGGEG